MIKSSDHIDPTFKHRRKIIGVMGSGRKAFLSLSEPVGRLIAKLGHHLLTGGGGGVMEAVSKAYSYEKRREGSIIGIIRAGGFDHLGEDNLSREYRPKKPPNEWIEIPIFTHLPYSGKTGKKDLSRNHLNVLSSDIVVVLPGGRGTFSEVQLAFQYKWPVILYLGDQKVDGKDAATIAELASESVEVVQNIDDLEKSIKKMLESFTK